MPLKDTQDTIEFFTPTLGLTVEPYIAANQKQGIHHVGRYEWACAALRQRSAVGNEPKRILDIACGSGYGSFMLANSFPRAMVIGSDYDDRAIVTAKAGYEHKNLTYLVADMVTWTSAGQPLGSFDVIVSFDTIEHVLH